MAKVLITGGAGFIGSNLAKALDSISHEVITLDIKNIKKQNHIVADVTDKDALKKACKDTDYIFHLAAVTSPPEFLDPMGDNYRINVIGTYNVLAAGLSVGVKRVIIASSSSVYGNVNSLASEELLPKQYDNFYPLSKLINELTAKTFVKYGLETISLRYFNTYGMEKMKGKYSSVIWKFIDDMMNGRQPVIYGDGTQSRDFIYVDDVVRATILAMDRGVPGEAYNVGTGISTSFNEVFRIIKELTGYRGEPRYVPNPYKSYQKFTRADTAKAKKELGFEAEYNIRAGVKKILDELSYIYKNKRQKNLD